MNLGIMGKLVALVVSGLLLSLFCLLLQQLEPCVHAHTVVEEKIDPNWLERAC